jgi:hypothetical protein
MFQNGHAFNTFYYFHTTYTYGIEHVHVYITHLTLARGILLGNPLSAMCTSHVLCERDHDHVPLGCVAKINIS